MSNASGTIPLCINCGDEGASRYINGFGPYCHRCGGIVLAPMLERIAELQKQLDEVPHLRTQRANAIARAEAAEGELSTLRTAIHGYEDILEELQGRLQGAEDVAIPLLTQRIEELKNPRTITTATDGTEPPETRLRFRDPSEEAET